MRWHHIILLLSMIVDFASSYSVLTRRPPLKRTTITCTIVETAENDYEFNAVYFLVAKDWYSNIGMEVMNVGEYGFEPTDFRVFETVNYGEGNEVKFWPVPTTVFHKGANISVEARYFANMHYIFAIGTDLWDSVTYLHTEYYHNGEIHPTKCREERIPACNDLDVSTFSFPSNGVSIGVPLVTRVVPQRRAADPTAGWVVEVSGNSRAQYPMIWSPKSRAYEAEIVFRAVGKHFVKPILKFPSRGLALTGRPVPSSDVFESMFCGDPLVQVDVEVSKFCPRGNLMGTWIRIDPVERWEEQDCSVRNSNSCDEKEFKTFQWWHQSLQPPLYRWVPDGGCQLSGYTPTVIMEEMQQRSWEEFIMIGDSREGNLMRKIQENLESDGGFSGRIQHESYGDIWHGGADVFGYKNLKFFFVSSRTFQERANRTEKGDTVWDDILDFTLTGMKLSNACAAGKSGVILFSIALWELRHIDDFGENGLELYLERLMKKCPSHTFFFLTMQAIHDPVNVHNCHDGYVTCFERVGSWFPRQNEETLAIANEIGKMAAEKFGIQTCDVFTPTFQRPDGTRDGVHYENIFYKHQNVEIAHDGHYVSKQLEQLIWNCVLQ